jgi:hypothetical protein
LINRFSFIKRSFHGKQKFAIVWRRTIRRPWLAGPWFERRIWGRGQSSGGYEDRDDEMEYSGQGSSL